MRCLRELVCLGSGFLFACASTQTSESALPPLPVPPPVTARPAPSAPRNVGSDGVFVVEGEDGLARLCETLREENSMVFSGNAVAQAQAREEHTRRRQEAEHRRYAAMVPAAGFALANYELAERRLVLDTSRGFRLADGAELVTNLETGVLGFRLPPEGADRILVDRAAGKLFLRVLFRPTYSKMRQQACLWVSGGSVVKMETELESVALLAPDGTRLAQGDNNPGGDMDTPVSRPQVLIKRPRNPSGGDVSEGQAKAAKELGPHLLPCYRKALEGRPGLRGTLVLGLKVGSDGSVEEARMELSSLEDEALAACAVTVASKVKLGAGPGRMSVTAEFSSKDDR
jgi:hypothetical protein